MNARRSSVAACHNLRVMQARLYLGPCSKCSSDPQAPVTLGHPA